MTENHAQRTWDDRYREAERMWSGKVNAALADIVGTLSPGTVLDLGSGEGADVVWLAEHGWQATGVDISPVAVARAEEAARGRGLSEDQARFVVADLTHWVPKHTYDLVVSSFLHSHGDFDRAGILRSLKHFVSDGGHLLIISHATFPPWAQTHRDGDEHDHHHDATTPDSELQLLDLDPSAWSVEVAQLRSREATGPNGQSATLQDTVVLLRKATDV